MNNLYELTAKELRDKFLSDELSAVEIVNSFYKRIEKVEDKIKSFVSLRKEKALEEAKKLDEKKKNGEKQYRQTRPNARTGQTFERYLSLTRADFALAEEVGNLDCCIFQAVRAMYGVYAE